VIHDRVNQLDKTSSIEHFQINLIGKCSVSHQAELFMISPCGHDPFHEAVKRRHSELRAGDSDILKAVFMGAKDTDVR
jgi:hypothetical protein